MSKTLFTINIRNSSFPNNLTYRANNYNNYTIVRDNKDIGSIICSGGESIFVQTQEAANVLGLPIHNSSNSNGICSTGEIMESVLTTRLGYYPISTILNELDFHKAINAPIETPYDYNKLFAEKGNSFNISASGDDDTTSIDTIKLLDKTSNQITPSSYYILSFNITYKLTN